MSLFSCTFFPNLIACQMAYSHFIFLKVFHPFFFQDTFNIKGLFWGVYYKLGGLKRRPNLPYHLQLRTLYWATPEP
jgi:hypothetical protein